MNSPVKKFIGLAAFSFHFFSAAAQIDLSKYEIGVQGSAFVYQGDLTPERFGAFKTMKPGFGFLITRIVSSSFLIQFNVMFGRLHGDDAKYSSPGYRQQRNFAFTTPVKEFTVKAVWDLLGKNGYHYGFSPYFFAGAGLSFVRITKDYSRMNTTIFPAESDVQAGLNADNAHALPRVLPVMPVGAGVKYALSEKFSMFAETSYRLMRSDYLDGFSQSVNPKQKDHYHTTSLGLIYSFGKKNKLGCPAMKY